MNALETLNAARRAWERTQAQLTLEVDWLTSQDLPSLPAPVASLAASSPKADSSGRRAAAEHITSTKER